MSNLQHFSKMMFKIKYVFYWRKFNNIFVLHVKYNVSSNRYYQESLVH